MSKIPELIDTKDGQYDLFETIGDMEEYYSPKCSFCGLFERSYSAAYPRNDTYLVPVTLNFICWPCTKKYGKEKTIDHRTAYTAYVKYPCIGKIRL